MSLSSCHSAKKAANALDTSTNSAIINTTPVDTRFNDLVQSYSSWNDVYMPVNINLDSPQSLSVSSRLTMIRDKVIHLSMRVFGMEVAVVHVNCDSIFIADKYHKQLFAESLKDVMAQYPVTLANVQDLMLGRLFALGHDSLSTSDLTLFDLSRSDDGSIWFASPHNTIDNVAWHFTLTGKSPFSVLELNFLRNEIPVDIEYSKPMSTTIGAIPSIMSISATFPKFPVRASLQYKISDAQWNKNRTVDWTVPRNYQRLSTENLRSMFKL